MKRIFSQSSILLAGLIGAQGLAFLRNAILGHWLSNGDFGVAATITLMLQLFESLSDLGADRLILQADDGAEPRLLASAHTLSLARGLILAILLFAAAHPAAGFFSVPDAAWAFQAIALVPVIKAFVHLDMRRRQRDLENLPYALVEAAPQAAALAATVPVLMWRGDFSAVVFIAFIQAIAALAISHLVAKTPYRTSTDRATLSRFVAFGWPIWLSAFPLVVVLQGDKLIIARFFTMQDLAAYSAVFMVTMTPAMLIARIAVPMLLPLFARQRARPARFARLYRAAGLFGAVGALGYWLAFAVTGGWLVTLAFGPGYAGLGEIAALLAAMWALRIAQTVSWIALMSVAATTEIFYGGLIRAAAILPVAIVAASGYGLTAIVWCGVVGEAAALVFALWRAGRLCPVALMPVPATVAEPT